MVASGPSDPGGGASCGARCRSSRGWGPAGRGAPMDSGRAAEHGAQDVVRLAHVLRSPSARDESEDFLGFLGGNGAALVADVGEIAEGHLERDRDAVEAVDGDGFFAALDLADEFSAEPRALAEPFLAERPLLAECPQTLPQKPPHVLDGALCHEIVLLLGLPTVTTFSWLCNRSEDLGFASHAGAWRTRSGQVDFDAFFAHADRVDADGKARRDPALAAAEVEIVPVPRADDRVAVDPALDQRAVLVRAGGTRGDEPVAAGVEEHDRQAAVLDQRALTRCDVFDGRDPHVRHQRRPFNASSTMDRNSSTLMAPTTGRPLIRNAGVLFTPSACACAMSRSTSPAKRR